MIVASNSPKLSGITCSTISPSNFVTHSFPLQDISAAFKTFIERIGGAIKVVVKPNE